MVGVSHFADLNFSPCLLSFSLLTKSILYSHSQGRVRFDPEPIAQLQILVTDYTCWRPKALKCDGCILRTLSE